MKHRRPTARDRELARLLLDLPEGKHLVTVEPEKGQAMLKPEGGMIFIHWHEGDQALRRYTIVPRGAGGFVRVTLEKAKTT